MALPHGRASDTSLLDQSEPTQGHLLGSLQPILFRIVNASIDEADIGSISDQADARFTVDAYPNETFRGQIEEVRLNPTTVQNVVTYSVILSFDNSELKLKPGMTANVTLTVERRDKVLKIPNAALRYTPAGVQKEPTKTSAERILGDDAEDTREAPASASKPPEQRMIDLGPGQKWNPAAKLRLCPRNAECCEQAESGFSAPKENQSRRISYWELRTAPQPRLSRAN